MKIFKNLLFISCLFLFIDCERNQVEVTISKQLSEGDDVNDLVAFWKMMSIDIQEDLEDYNVLELSAQLSEDGKVEEFKLNGEKIEIKERAISFANGTDSKGGKWNYYKKFCKSCTPSATLWLKETVNACQCA
jgi:hypothetical protein